MTSKNPAVEQGNVTAEEQSNVALEEATNEGGHALDADPTVEGDVPLSQQQWYRQLVGRWQKHHEVTLKLRYDTGDAINL